jgi:hypothetical protein
MKKSFLFGAMVLLVNTSPYMWSGEIPSELIGEWATKETEFVRGGVSKGTAIYLGREGAGFIISAPPPIGAKGAASFNAEKQTLTMKMAEAEKSMGVFEFRYDSKTKTLKSRTGAFGTSAFSRRRDRVPKQILEEMK